MVAIAADIHGRKVIHSKTNRTKLIEKKKRIDILVWFDFGFMAHQSLLVING